MGQGKIGKLRIVALGDLLKDIDRDLLDAMLGGFCCTRDADVQGFLRFEAIKHEYSNKAKTYVCQDETGDIVGYFALAIKSIAISDSLFATHRKELEALSHTPVARDCKYIHPYVPAYVLALIGKDDTKFSKDKFGGPFLGLVIETILKIIQSAQRNVGGQVLYLDCEKGLMGYYGNNENGFSFFQENPDNKADDKESDKLYQMWKSLV